MFKVYQIKYLLYLFIAIKNNLKWFPKISQSLNVYLKFIHIFYQNAFGLMENKINILDGKDLEDNEPKRYEIL